MLQGTSADTALCNWYDSTATANIGLFKNVADSIDANPQQAKEVNDGISPDNHAEENEKAVNAVYIETWAVDSFEFTTEQYDILYAIANENPLTSGTGVYAARVMLGLHIDDDYESISSRMANPNGTQSAAVADNKIKLMPNPATNKVDYYNKLNKGEAGKVIIYSKIGVEMDSQLLHEGINNLSFDLHRLTSGGVYIVETAINGKASDRRKLVIIK